MGKAQRLSKTIRRLKERMKIRYTQMSIHEVSRVGIIIFYKYSKILLITERGGLL